MYAVPVSPGLSGGMTISNPLDDSTFKTVIAVSVVSTVLILIAIGVIFCWGHSRCCFGRRRQRSSKKQASDIEVQRDDSQNSSVINLVQPGSDLKPPVL